MPPAAVAPAREAATALRAPAPIAPSPNGCPACATVNAPDARYCVDCGFSLTPCPACASPVHGDFCEACGHWLREGQCRFCYAALADGAQFCEDCGCNQAGMACAGCGRTSFFDFCTGCGDAVTERAQAAVQSPPSAALSAELVEIRALQAELEALADTATDTHAAAPPPSLPPARLISRQTLEGLRDTVASLQRGEAQARQASQDAESARAATIAAVQAQAEQARDEARQQERRAHEVQGLNGRRLTISARLRAARERALAIAAASEALRFADGQQARCHMMAVRQQLAAEGMVPRFWRCNAFHADHPGPNDCAKPEDGGVWIF